MFKHVDSSVSKETGIGWTTSVQTPFLFVSALMLAVGIHLTCYTMGTGDYFLGIKRSERQSNNSLHIMSKNTLRRV
jgi:hypothetical protein